MTDVLTVAARSDARGDAALRRARRGRLARRARTVAFVGVDALLADAPERLVAQSQVTKSIVTW